MPEDPTGGGPAANGAGNAGDSGEDSSSSAGGDSTGPTEPDLPGDAGSSSTPPESGTPIAVAVGYGLRRVMSSDGMTWTNFQEADANGGDDENLLRGVGYGDHQFLAVGNVTLHSTDGATWEERDARFSARGYLSNAVFFKGFFVAVGGNGLRVRSVDGGSRWQDDPGHDDIHFRRVAASSEYAVAAGHTYDNVGVLSRTADGIEWQELVREGAMLNRIAHGNGSFVATGSEGRCTWSEDTDRWSPCTVGGTPIHHLVFVNDQFIASTDGGIFVSTSGEAWTRASEASNQVYGYFMGSYLSLGWPADVQVSADLAQWQRVYHPEGSGLVDVAIGYVGE